MNEQTIKEMRQKLEDFSMDVPSVSWDALETALASNQPSVRRQRWQRIGAAAAIVLLLASGAWWMLSGNDGDSKDAKRQARQSVPAATQGTTAPATGTDPTDTTTTAEHPSETLREPSSDAVPSISRQTPQQLSAQSKPDNDAGLRLSHEKARNSARPQGMTDSKEADRTSSLSLVAKDGHSENQREAEPLPQLLAETEPQEKDTGLSPHKPEDNTPPAISTAVKPSEITAQDNRKPDNQQPSGRNPQRPTRQLPALATTTGGQNTPSTDAPKLMVKAFFANNGLGGSPSSIFDNSSDYYSSPGDEPLNDPEKPGGNDPDKPGGDKPDSPGGNDDPGKDDSNGKLSPRKVKTEQKSEENVRHHQPLRFGIMVSYRLNARWSIEGGLTYTRQSSDISDGKENYEKWHQTKQQLNYIGIPVNISYSIWQNRRFSIYASAGIMAEKMFKGEQTIREMNFKYQKSIETKDIHIHPLQFSLNAAAGAEFKLNRTFSVYAEPGLSYHFKNSTSVHTFYGDYPVGLNLSLGLRLNIK